MALIKCPECEKEISNLAKNCPYCGYPLEKQETVEEKQEPAEEKQESAEEKQETAVEKPQEATENKTVSQVTEEKKTESFISQIIKMPYIKWGAVGLAAVAVIIAAVLIIPKIGKGAAEVTESEVVSKQAESQQETQSTPKEVKRDDTEFEEYAEGLVNATTASITEEYNKIAGNIGDSYDGYKNNIEAVSAWYAFCEAESEKLYDAIISSSFVCYQEVGKSDKIKEYRQWHRALEDIYDIWNDGLKDYYDDWNDLYDDAYHDFDDVISKGYNSNYRETSDLWEDMYDAYSDSWENMYDLYSDKWEDLYDLYSDVSSAFYDGDTNIEEIYNKIVN
ncbi:MAG: zinc ribbon domain-containing protein [Clostridia bacterium]|nr:zinc ribbon domain-containing protein [Clostridia bacterium]